MPTEFLLQYTSFDAAHQPFFTCQSAEEMIRIPLFNQGLSLIVDTSIKHCTGWIDLLNKTKHACPDTATVDKKYETCIGCRHRTGFNPAFYNTTGISEQQQQINQQPHFVYLAYFAPGIVKVGISQEARGIRRLLEQGARAALKLETFPTALIARQYEASISQMPGMLEHLPQHKKLSLLSQRLSLTEATKELWAWMTALEQNLNVQFPRATTVDTECHFYHQPVDMSSLIIIDQPTAIVGRVVAVIGSIVCTEWQGNVLAYDIKKGIGYKMSMSPDATIALPDKQLTLF